jgi:hypothetical protein
MTEDDDDVLNVEVVNHANGVQTYKFECPDCKKWSPVTDLNKIRITLYDCLHCEFARNESMDHYDDEDLN